MKVFCIGFNKTGTTSLHEYFEQAGLSSSHDPGYQANTRTMDEAELRAYLDAYDAFSDGERANVPRLLELYPDAKFVLNTRGLKSWLESRVKHVFRLEGAALEGPGVGHSSKGEQPSCDPGGPRPGAWSGAMAREYLHDPERAISDWIDRREFYHRSVMELFATGRRSSFLRLNVIQDPLWHADLGSFLGLIAPLADTFTEIHANVASADTSLPEISERVRQIERVLVQKNIPREEWDSDTYIGFA